MIKILSFIVFTILFCNSSYAQEFSDRNNELYQVIRKQLKHKSAQINKLSFENSEIKIKNIELQGKIDYLISQEKIKERKLTRALKEAYSSIKELDLREQELNRAKSSLNNLLTTNSRLIKKNKELSDSASVLFNRYSMLTSDLEQSKKINLEYEKNLEEELLGRERENILRKAKGLLKEKKNKSNLSTAEKKELTYLSLSTGFGSNYSGAGLNLQSRFGRKTGIGFHLSGGVFPTEAIFAGGGVKLFFYKGGYVDFSYNRIVRELDSINNRIFGSNLYSSSLGYDAYNEDGFGIRLGAGGLLTNDNLVEKVVISIDLGLCYKF